MKAFSGYEPKRSYVREQLPAGGYVVKIMDVKLMHDDWDDILLLSFDVEEGDKKGFFRDDYRARRMKTRSGGEPTACASPQTMAAIRTHGRKTPLTTLCLPLKTAIRVSALTGTRTSSKVCW